MISFAVTIFLGAFLLFQVQPLMGRYIVPWFGGAASVWTTCLLFFQIFLLFGYAYAHGISRLRTTRAQGWIHIGLVAVSLLLPIAPGIGWRPGPNDSPTGRILLLLVSTIGVPYLVLASTGPLMQQWFSRAQPGRSPYRLYALSNIASLLALISYPLLFEPTLDLSRQTSMWSWVYGLFAVSAVWCASLAIVRGGSGDKSGGQAGPLVAHPPGGVTPVGLGVVALWLALSACGSAMLLAITNQLTQEVASVPFLWILPLALYLLTFIICFDNEQWYTRRRFGTLLAFMAVLTVAMLLTGTSARLWTQIVVYSGLLFASCMVCHGELVRSRPAAGQLTLFYLMIAAGGAMGGGFVALVAPAIFRGFWELHTALFAVCALALVAAFRDQRTIPDARVLARSYALGGGLLLLIGVLGLMVRAGVGLRPATWGSVLQRAMLLWRTEWLDLLLASVCGAALILAARMDLARARRALSPVWYRPALSLCAAALGLALIPLAQADRGESIHAERNFYGVLRVAERHDSLGAYRVLVNGRIAHGRQYLSEDERLRPIAYYDSASGVGLTLAFSARRAAVALPRRNLRVGVVGLGAGTVAAYGKSGDVYRFYEINPADIRVAGDYFTYLRDSRAKIELVLGDGRIQLEDELQRGGSQQFDLLVIDAFTSDAIPVHLLTVECTALYLRHMKPDGLLLFHVSNRYVNLRPVIRGLAQRFGLRGMWIVNGGRVKPGVLGSSWMILGRPGNPIFDAAEVADSTSAFPTELITVARAAGRRGTSEAEIDREISAGQLTSVMRDGGRYVQIETDPPPILWTDGRSSLWPVLRFR